MQSAHLRVRCIVDEIRALPNLDGRMLSVDNDQLFALATADNAPLGRKARPALRVFSTRPPPVTHRAFARASYRGDTA
jgi:hypothetical protein